MTLPTAQSESGGCSTCETADWDSNESLIPVWEDPADYNRGVAPDFIGCTECHTMDRYSEDGDE